ncbi:hypothetical protein THAOC_33253 [Thalassiosira oceanica]|uniref:Uncharacterized protein n=1 Tax=Thalassiosira oceanica TaxID=159749 RepID=K0RMM6_THAOC|nr:hypothetical protein THAOC_33253 [Thalassiosira oceanica]|eukprot:EJK47992.1 hypothetical protein THAOC_33253 [Thalassiosira oceanica]
MEEIHLRQRKADGPNPWIPSRRFGPWSSDFWATLHQGGRKRSGKLSWLAHQSLGRQSTHAHHQVDSQRKSRQSSVFRQLPEASGGSTYEPLDIADTIIDNHVVAAPIDRASGAG